MVAATGDWRLLTLDINLNRMPSRAMAKRMRGRGNMEPNRLGRRGFMVKLRAFWERKHNTCTTVKEQQNVSRKPLHLMSLSDTLHLWLRLSQLFGGER